MNYNKAIEIDPNISNPYNSLGVSFLHLEEFQKGIVNFTKAIEINSLNPMIYFFRGICYNCLNLNSEAVEDMKKAQTLGYEDASIFIEALLKNKLLNGEIID